LSKKFTHFVADQYSEGSVSQKFNLDEYVREAKALEPEFVHDLEQQRRVEETKTPQTDDDEGEASLLREMKEQAEKIQEEARQQGYQQGQTGRNSNSVHVYSSCHTIKKR